MRRKFVGLAPRPWIAFVLGWLRGLFGDLVLRPWFAFGLGLLPLVAFWASDSLLQQAGLRFDWMPSHFAEFDPDRAEALRLTVFGAFLLFAACAIAAILYFLFTLRLLRPAHVLAMLIVFLLTNLVSGDRLVSRASAQADKFVGSALVCTALGYDSKTSKNWIRTTEKEEIKVEVQNALANGKPCGARASSPSSSGCFG